MNASPGSALLAESSRLPARAPAHDAPADIASRAPYVAIALISCALLLYEVAIIRVLSVVLWYHFAFLTISLALLGLGLPGIWFTLRAPGRVALPAALAGAAAAIPGSIAVLFTAGDVVRSRPSFAGLSVLGSPGVLVAVACLLVPFLFLGSGICLLLMQARGRAIGWMYGADLLGATAGAFAVVPLMLTVPTPLIVAASGLLPIAAAVLLFKKLRPLYAVGAACLVALLIWHRPFQLTYSKSYAEPPNLLYKKWTPTARITIFPNVFYVKDPSAAFGWGMGSRYEPKPLPQLWIEQDGSAGTPITRYQENGSDLEHLFFDVTSAAYQLRPPESVCVVGAGGGRDVLTAYKAGAKRIDAVELNPAIVEAITGPFREFSGDVYNLPGVRPVVSEGRSFLTHTPSEYDLIQISLIDSWAATAAGAFSLSENYLYTVEALRLYLRRTAPDGLLSISRWMTGERQLEGARLAHLIETVLRLEGLGSPAQHLAVLQAWSVGTFVISKQPFSASDRARLAQIAKERGFQQRWPTGPHTKPSLVASVLENGTGSLEQRGVNLTPPTDDRPFFFQAVSLFGNTDGAYLAKLSNNEHSVALLKTLWGVVSVLALGLFFTPFLLRRRRSARSTTFWTGSGFFLCIGLAFMLVEMPLLQRFVLYLGHPSYATTVVLASLLLGAGCGSMVASRIGAGSVRRYGAILPALVIAANFLLEPLFQATLGWSFGVRIAVSAAVLIPLGFLMGAPFPVGMMAFGEQHKPWFWAVNGAFSVLASVSSLVLSMTFGFSVVTVLGALFYALAWGVLLIARPWSEPNDDGYGLKPVIAPEGST